VAAFGLRVFNRAQREVSKVVEKEVIPSFGNSPAQRDGSGYFGQASYKAR
jgi:hypothetical protein